MQHSHHSAGSQPADAAGPSPAPPADGDGVPPGPEGEDEAMATAAALASIFSEEAGAANGSGGTPRLFGTSAPTGPGGGAGGGTGQAGVDGGQRAPAYLSLGGSAASLPSSGAARRAKSGGITWSF